MKKRTEIGTEFKYEIIYLSVATNEEINNGKITPVKLNNLRTLVDDYIKKVQFTGEISDELLEIEPSYQRSDTRGMIQNGLNNHEKRLKLFLYKYKNGEYIKVSELDNLDETDLYISTQSNL